MKAKKMVAAFLAMAAATALIAGCGGGDKKESSGGEKKFINIATGGTSGIILWAGPWLISLTKLSKAPMLRLNPQALPSQTSIS